MLPIFNSLNISPEIWIQESKRWTHFTVEENADYSIAGISTDLYNADIGTRILN